MNRDLCGLSAVTFVLTTILDIRTTRVGVHQLGYTELSPLTDTSSIRAMAIPGVITLFIGIACVALGAHFTLCSLSFAFAAPRRRSAAIQ